MNTMKYFTGTLCALISVSALSQSRSAQTQICYPTYKSEKEYCQVVLVDEYTIVDGIVGPSEIENGLTAISNYGFELTDTLDKIDIKNPALELIIKSQKDKAIEAIAAAGGGPALAILNFALNNTLTGGSGPDPISQMAEVILNRLAEVEERVIARIDSQFQTQARDTFSGLSQLYEIYGTANTIEKRAAPLYVERLSTVDTNLDTLIENFENDRFSGAHVKNYHVYLELITLRLAVLAEVERITYYQLNGQSLEGVYEEYKDSLNMQYKIVLSDVFDYINFMTDSPEWEEENQGRFDLSTVSSSSTFYANSQWEYDQTVRPKLYDIEKNFSDSRYSYTTGGRNSKRVYRTYGHNMYFRTFNYTFNNIDQPLHISRFIIDNGRQADSYDTYAATDAFGGDMKLADSCTQRSNQCHNTNPLMMLSRAQSKVREIQEKHIERGFHQFIRIYYEPTIEILDKWYNLYRPGESRPKNRLDLIVDDMN